MPVKIRSLLWLAVVVVALGAGRWVWRQVRHARLDLVTLHVRDASVPEVIRRMARQTGEIVVAEPHFRTNAQLRVNLALDAFPLARALEAVAEQVGGLRRTTYSVHDSERAARELIRNIEAGIGPTPEGWTNLTGTPPPPPMPSETADPGDGPQIQPLPEGFVPNVLAGPPSGDPAGPKRRIIVDAEDIVAGPGSATDGSGGREGPPRGLVVRRWVSRANPDGGVEVLDVSPERLLLERRLLSRFPDLSVPADVRPSAGDAERLARAARGQWSVIHALERSPVPNLGPGARGLAEDGKGQGLSWQGTRRTGAGGRADGGDQPVDLVARAQERMRHERLDRIERLTPEQRARAAAEARRAAVVETETSE